MARKKIFDIVLKRNGSIYLKIQIDPTIEDLFRNENVRTSSRWTQADGTPLDFYRLPSTATDLSREFRYDDYGQNFLNEEGRVNFAILRTKGLSGGIEFKIPETGHSQETLEKAAKDLRDKIAIIHKKYCKPVAIKGYLEIEEMI